VQPDGGTARYPYVSLGGSAYHMKPAGHFTVPEGATVIIRHNIYKLLPAIWKPMSEKGATKLLPAKVAAASRGPLLHGRPFSLYGASRTKT
jgi:hypothetical protein